MKIEFEKGFSPFPGRRLISGPPAEAGPRSTPPRAAPSPRPSPTRAPGLPLRWPAHPAYLSAVPRLFPRATPDRVRARSPRGRHAPAMHATRQPRPASPSTCSPSSAAPTALPTSLSRAASLLCPHRALLLRRHRYRSPAGKIGRWCSTIARNQAHIAPPRSSTPGARGSDTF